MATSSIATMMHLLKGNIGTGILAIPKSFVSSGILVGTLGIPIMGFIATICMHSVIKCLKRLCVKYKQEFMDYEEVAEKAALSGPNWLNKRAWFARMVVSAFLLLTQFGFCVAYSLFVAINVHRFIKKVAGDTVDMTYLSEKYILLMELPFMILLNCVRNLKRLAIASSIANILQVAGLTIILFNLSQDIPSLDSRPLTADLSALPMFFGTAIYTFEGIGIVLPLQKEMREPKAFEGCCGVLNNGMIMVTILYTVMGFFGYLKYGEALEASITLNLPSTPMYQVIPLMFAIAVFLSYALQFYVPFNILWPYFQDKLHLSKETTECRIAEYIFRALLVSMTFFLAAAIPDLELCISLVGAFASSALALIIPPIIELATFWDAKISSTHWKLLVVKNTIISLFGVVGFLTGTYAAMIKIISKFQEHTG